MLAGSPVSCWEPYIGSNVAVTLVRRLALRVSEAAGKSFARGTVDELDHSHWVAQQTGVLCKVEDPALAIDLPNASQSLLGCAAYPRPWPRRLCCPEAQSPAVLQA